MKKEKKPFREWSTGKKVTFISGMAIVGLIATLLTGVAGYVGYVSAQYYRIEDNYDLTGEIKRGATTSVELDTEYKVATYNIGFGAYDRDYTFFMDGGYMKDGTYKSGHYGKCASKERARTNTDGAIKAIKDLNADFSLLQEVETKGSTRTFGIDQYAEYQQSFYGYDSVLAKNFHSAFIAYPFKDMIGVAEAGVATLSKYKIDSVTRRSYPLDESWPWNLFDLDRCFSVARYQLSNGKEFVLCNSHMSAYDEGGIIRAKQLEMLNGFFKEEYEKGNYVLLGGDFNHDIAKSSDLKEGDPNYHGHESYFMTDQVHPDWVAHLDEDKLTDGYHIGTSLNAPTCRAAEMPYTRIYSDDGDRTDEEGKTYYLSNYTVVIDGFIYSDNITVTSVVNDPNNVDFMYSDHNPAIMTFKLNG